MTGEIDIDTILRTKLHRPPYPETMFTGRGCWNILTSGVRGR